MVQFEDASDTGEWGNVPFLAFIVALLVGLFLAFVGAFTVTSLASSASPPAVTAPLVSYGTR